MITAIARGMIFSVTFGALSLSANAGADKSSSGMGHDLAKAKCSGCHLIEPGQKNPPDHVGGPAFQTIADRSDTTDATLRKSIESPHSGKFSSLLMPNQDLPHNELNEIVDYLMSLKKTAKN